MNNDQANLNVPVHIPLPALATSRGALIISTLRVRSGRWELTRDQLVFYQFSRWYAAFGLLGALLMRYATGKRALDLDLRRIATVTRGRYGRNKKVMDVTMVDGQQHRLVVDSFDEVAARLHDVMGGRGLALAA
jgi:hypothetical protein